ncbi:hypothetical protein N7532_002575 [Penicillium argentinense]|uniref:Uncharacterized protein n=1 Tax=Penicillium argentinense TaxID=1131581 RepID=A0A9W9G0L6_9EURO|nr:uncharacterized protein N7532_002575 [Penicillium argentinense]KAJ5109930.1 hypothetical protein N7532_002575 [Penicillium argentinense]
MEIPFLHSISIDEKTARHAGVFTTLPVRKSKHSDIADRGAQRAIQAWEKHAKEDHSKTNFQAVSPSMDQHGNKWAYLSPEALPERLALLVYLSDFGTIYDGI